MLNEMTSNDLFTEYYKEWVTIYKENAVRQVTLNKYRLAHAWLKKLAPDVTLGKLDRITYQNILNGYASKT